MNNLSQLLQQIGAIWKQLGLNQRISVVMAAGVVALGLSSVVFLSVRVDYALLYGKLDDAEAAKVIAALDDAKVPYKISRGGGAISVPADKVHLMRMQLAAKGIPRASGGVGFEILDKANFGISDFLQRANYIRAVQGELARTISQVDMVEGANVIVAQPETRLVVDSQKRTTASVFLRIRGDNTLPQQAVNAIRFLVANAVEGLQPNYVSIMDSKGNSLSDNNENDPMGGLTSSQLLARKNMEAYLAKKAESMLDRVLGAGQSVVRVSTEINYDTSTRIEEKFDPDGQVIRTSTVNDETVDTVTSNPEGANSGVPGTQQNSSTETNTTAATSANSNKTRKKVANNQYEINKLTSNFTQAAGTIKRLSAAVFVAVQMDGRGAARQVKPRSKEDLDKIRRIVQSAIGIQDGVDNLRKDEIALEEIEFNDRPVIEMTQKMDQEEKRQFWWNLVKNAVYPLLALITLGYFWRVLKRTQETIPIGIPLGDSSRSSGPKDAVISVDALNQMIRENPTNMTQAIRGWMQGSNKR